MKSNRTGKRVLAKLAKEKAAQQEARRERRRQAAQQILTALIASGLSQQQVGEYIGVAQPVISRNLHGRTTPSPMALACLIGMAKEHNVDLPEGLEWRPL
jgi:hypothetical protein